MNCEILWTLWIAPASTFIMLLVIGGAAIYTRGYSAGVKTMTNKIDKALELPE